ncbi:hypothetical protein BWI93_10615 [Siphonobacter sp. BAB-5385]|uniref:hypothetical protein n=1 Tax=Siphonobacter sp. BAB-5385 TaxID=1864822 RepID=UPI000B9E4F3C|nr:hypothetical protein [Siphonobacter sp. BAB-5385]OZI08161.1 hypothetical protein BWI93_10615 [Siphonobacter sp. BAB-5385]
MKKKKIIFWIISILLIVSVSNIPIVSFFISFFTGNLSMMNPDYHYISQKGGFSIWGRKGSEDVLSQFEAYKKRHPEDTVLYRNFQIKPWQFWRIYEYTDPCYRLPYQQMPPNVSVDDVVKQ